MFQKRCQTTIVKMYVLIGGSNVFAKKCVKPDVNKCSSKSLFSFLSGPGNPKLFKVLDYKNTIFSTK